MRIISILTLSFFIISCEKDFSPLNKNLNGTYEETYQWNPQPWNSLDNFRLEVTSKLSFNKNLFSIDFLPYNESKTYLPDTYFNGTFKTENDTLILYFSEIDTFEKLHYKLKEDKLTISTISTKTSIEDSIVLVNYITSSLVWGNSFMKSSGHFIKN